MKKCEGKRLGRYYNIHDRHPSPTVPLAFNKESLALCSHSIYSVVAIAWLADRIVFTIIKLTGRLVMLALVGSHHIRLLLLVWCVSI